MTKTDYLDALKKALAALPGRLPAHVVTDTISEYARRFADGIAAGRSEEEIAQSLPDPAMVAATVGASTHHEPVQATRSKTDYVRLFFASLGVLVFNLFMVLPALVYSALLLAFYAAALGFYIGGIGMTASSLSGVNEFALYGPLENVFYSADDDAEGDADRHVNVAIGDTHIRAEHEAAATLAPDGASPVTAADDVVQIVSGKRSAARPRQTLHGIAIILGGIAMLLLAVLLTKYTWIGIKRYVQMNIAILRN